MRTGLRAYMRKKSSLAILPTIYLCSIALHVNVIGCNIEKYFQKTYIISETLLCNLCAPKRYE
jgi:ABC-type dipeptide/oligopeptide/nickel transport system permease subunit